MKEKIFSILKYVLFFGLGIGILYYLYYTTNQSYQQELLEKGLPPQDYLIKLGNDFKNANYFWLSLVVLAFLLSNVSRAIRWKMLLDPLKEDGEPKVSFKNSFLGVLVNYVVNLVIPRAGEVARCGVLTRYEKIPLEKGLGTVVVDRILDVICLALMMVLGLIVEFDKLWGYIKENALQSEEEGGGLPTWIWLGLGAIVIIGVLLFVFRKKIQATSIYKKILNLLMGFLQGIQAIQKLNNPLAFIGHTAFIWFMYYLMLYFAFFSFEPTAHLGMSAGLLIFIFGALGIVIPSPGGIGSYQYFVSTALVSFYAIGQSDALSFANIAFAAPFLCNIVFGVLALVLLPIVNRKK